VRVGIDGRYLGLRRGIGNLIHDLVGALGRLPRPPEVVVYVQEGRAEEMPESGAAVRFRALPRAPYPIWEQVLVPLAASRDRLDVLHSPANTGPLRLPRGLAQVVTIHDVMFLLPDDAVGRSPSTYQRLGRRYRRTVVPRVARRAAAIITDSEHSRVDLQRYIGVPAGRAHLVRGAVGDEFRVLGAEEARAGLPIRVPADSPYVLALGAVDPRKNTGRVLDAFARFRSAGFLRHRLVISGLDHDAGVRLWRRARELQIADHVTMLGFVPVPELVALYNGAQMFVYPSLYEGFGLPVLEGMACGVPVIASSTTSIPEVAGSAAVLVDPTDVEAIAHTMRLVASDEPVRRRMREHGLHQAGTFSWERAAAETLVVYEAALRS
jgi:glycosyltransferase involved in cell wall biosynthesis